MCKMNVKIDVNRVIIKKKKKKKVLLGFCQTGMPRWMNFKNFSCFLSW